MIVDKKQNASKEKILTDKGSEIIGKITGFCFCVTIITAAPAIWLYQLYYWLKYGEYYHISISDSLVWLGSNYPQSSWVKIQDFLDSAPISAPLAIAAIILISALLDDAKNKQDSR